MIYSRFKDLLLSFLPVAVALAFTTLILFLVGASPGEAYQNILKGALGSPAKRASVLSSWVPLLLCSAGLLVTFTAGLWNIGVEGQIMAGAILTAWLARTLILPRVILVPALLVGGMLGGGIWGLLAGLLKVKGKVHEIFGGVGLNYLAVVLANFLILGPWKPADGATMSGTDPFPRLAWLPLMGKLPVSPLALALGLTALGLASFVLRNTQWGLELKAMGKSPYAAFIRRVPTKRLAFLSLGLCGALAGLAGAILATGFRQRLVPQISGGYGFLSILVALLSRFRAIWVLPIGLFFAVLGVGSPRLELMMQLDSSLAGVLEGATVLCVLLSEGLRAYISQEKGG